MKRVFLIFVAIILSADTGYSQDWSGVIQEGSRQLQEILQQEELRREREREAARWRQDRKDRLEQEERRREEQEERERRDREEHREQREHEKRLLERRLEHRERKEKENYEKWLSTLDIFQRDEEGNTSLILYARKGDLSVTERLLKRGADVNARNKEGFTPFLYAVFTMNYPMISLLWDYTPDINMATTSGNTALIYAASKGNNSLVVKLLAEGADIKPSNNKGVNAYSAFEKNGDKNDPRYKQILELLRPPSFVNRFMSSEAAKVQAEAEKMISKKETEKEATATDEENEGQTALGILRRPPTNGRFECSIHSATCFGVQWDRVTEKKIISLARNQRVANSRNANGETPLHWAARFGKPYTVGYLLQMGADVNARNNDAKTPLMFALQYQPDLQIFLALINTGADVNAQDKWGVSPLMFAVLNPKTDPRVILSLMERGANAKMRDKWGVTALDFARSNNIDPQIISMMEKQDLNKGGIEIDK